VEEGIKHNDKLERCLFKIARKTNRDIGSIYLLLTAYIVYCSDYESKPPVTYSPLSTYSVSIGSPHLKRQKPSQSQYLLFATTNKRSTTFFSMFLRISIHCIIASLSQKKNIS